MSVVGVIGLVGGRGGGRGVKNLKIFSSYPSGMEQRERERGVEGGGGEEGAGWR